MKSCKQCGMFDAMNAEGFCCQSCQESYETWKAQQMEDAGKDYLSWVLP